MARPFDLKAFGKQIRAARQRLGWTQDDLQRAMGEARLATISDWERGIRPPESLEKVVRLGQGLGADLHALLTGEGELTRVSPSQERMQLRSARELVRELNDVLGITVEKSQTGVTPADLRGVPPSSGKSMVRVFTPD